METDTTSESSYEMETKNPISFHRSTKNSVITERISDRNNSNAFSQGTMFADSIKRKYKLVK